MMAKMVHYLDYELPPSLQDDLMDVVHPINKTAASGKPKQVSQSERAIKWTKFTKTNNIFVWIYLGAAGLIATIWILCTDLFIRYVMLHNRNKFTNSETIPYGIKYLLFILWTMVFGFAATLIVKKLCYAAAGSGVPDLKSLYSGFFKKEVVAPKVLPLKSIALIMSYGSGLSIGKEGPFVHLAAVIGNIILSFPPFNTHVATNETVRAHMIAAVSALGIAATFGAPIGGVLFGIEVTATYYLASNYWRSFFAAAVGAVGVKIALSSQNQTLLESFRTNLDPIQLASWQIISFILLGVFSGLLGSAFIWLYQQTVQWKKRHVALLTILTPYGEVLFVCFLTGLVSFPLLFLRLDHAGTVHAMFTNEGISDWYSQMFPNEPSFEENEEVIHTQYVRGAILLATMIYTVVKLFLTAISITLPIPYGIYIPLFAIGAAFGRGVGEFTAILFNYLGSASVVLPRGYAAVGAAALCGGATRTVSSAVIILELTNDLNYFIPVLLAVAIACGIGNVLNPSIYDTMIRFKGLPYLPFLSVKGDSTVAHDIMERKLFYVSQRTTRSEIIRVLDETTERIIPVVTSTSSMHFIGTIPRDTLERLKKIGPTDSLNTSRADLLAPSDLTSLIEAGAAMGESGPPGTEENETIFDLLLLSQNRSWVKLDYAPFMVTEGTPVRKILFMFTMLGGSELWVTYKGKLVGFITKYGLVKTLTPKMEGLH